MDLDFAVLADGVTQRPDGKLDIYGAGFDTINAASVPAVHARLVLALRILLSRHETEHPHRLDVILSAADGQELARAHGELGALEEEHRSQIPAGRQAGFQLVLNFENVVFPEFGAYQIAIHWDGNETRPPLRLSVAPPAATP
jgi:hypothetical protein